ncbi:MAG: ATP-grasp domain-containing protein, partial [Candidatus Thiodiazotropha endolucinida]
MNLHEYQAKSLFASYGIPVPQGQSVSSPNDARTAAQGLGGDIWAVKAQAHTGGRGKAGGVKLVHSL